MFRKLVDDGQPYTSLTSLILFHNSNPFIFSTVKIERSFGLADAAPKASTRHSPDRHTLLRVRTCPHSRPHLFLFFSSVFFHCFTFSLPRHTLGILVYVLGTTFALHFLKASVLDPSRPLRLRCFPFFISALENNALLDSTVRLILI